MYELFAGLTDGNMMERITTPARSWSTAPGLGVFGAAGADIVSECRAPSPDLSDVVDRFWRVRWKVHTDRSRAHLFIVPLPEVGLVSLGGQVALHGVLRAPRTWGLTGSGTAVGVIFRPGAAAAVLGPGALGHTDQVVPLPRTHWGLGSRQAAADITSAAHEELGVVARHFEGLLRTRKPVALDPQVERVAVIVEALRNGESLTRVAELSERFHLSPRTLQRTFQRHLGVSPKWLLSRYRLHRAAGLLQALPPERWNHLALDLGYFDDSHFARDFARTLGVTPIAFARTAVRGGPTYPRSCWPHACATDCAA